MNSFNARELLMLLQLTNECTRATLALKHIEKFTEAFNRYTSTQGINKLRFQFHMNLFLYFKWSLNVCVKTGHN